MLLYAILIAPEDLAPLSPEQDQLQYIDGGNNSAEHGRNNALEYRKTFREDGQGEFRAEFIM
jgi:hypothetical protein